MQATPNNCPREVHEMTSVHDGSGPIPWPNTAHARLLQAWLEPFWAEGTEAYIPNVHTRMFVVICGDVVLPISVGQKRDSRGKRTDKNSYVVSPSTHYIRYAVDETHHLSPAANLAARLVGWPLLCFAQATKLDRVVMVNNWLLATNLLPPIKPAQVRSIIATVRDRWPDHAVLFRSLAPDLHPEHHAELKAAGARMVFSRRIHLVRDPVTAATARSDNRKDARLERRSGLRREPFHPERDSQEVADLYAQLYLDKHSTCNPVFSARMIEHAARTGLFEVTVWRQEGEGDGDHSQRGPIEIAIGTWTVNGAVTAPMLGYNTRRPAKAGYYRIACRAILDVAIEQGALGHRSSGAAQFKQSRGAESSLEFNAVFDDHLSWWRRLPWRLFQRLLDRFVVPLMIRRNL